MPATIPLYSLIYRSWATHVFNEAALAEMLHIARQHNQQARLTGLLLYAQKQFLQVLEGPEPALSTLYVRIQADLRHGHVHLLAYGPIAARAFPDWRMGFAPQNATLPELTGFLPLATAPGLTTHPPAELARLLRDFAHGRAHDQ